MMKVSRTDLAVFLHRVNLGRLVDEVVLEKDGTITVSTANELILAGKSNSIFFDEPVAIQNLSLLIKIVSALSDEVITLSVVGKELVIKAREEVYNFRLAEADTIESLLSDRDEILAMKDKMAKVDVDLLKIRRIKQAISNLSAEKVSFFADKGILEAIVYDDATGSTATITLGKVAVDFKNNYNAEVFTKILDSVLLFSEQGESGANMYFDSDKPVIVALKNESFVYNLAYIIES